jgi:hypothetical protein
VSLDAAPVTVRTPSSLELTRAASNALTAPLYRDGAAVTATAVTASLVDGSGTAVATGGTLAAGVATWSLTPAATLTLGIGYRVEWQITHAGGIVLHQTSAAIVRRALYPVITDADLYRREPLLNPAAPGYLGPVGLTTWQDYIDEAWTELLARIWSQGSRPALVMSPEVLRAPHLYLTLAIAMRAMARDYDPRAELYHGLFESAWSSLRWVYDSDDDGAPDDEGQRVAGSPTLWTC